MQEKIATFLRNANPSATGGTEAILSSKDLFADGWLDSLLQLRLLAYLEEEFQTRIPPFRLSRSAFASVSSISALVEGK